MLARRDAGKGMELKLLQRGIKVLIILNIIIKGSMA